VRALPFAVSAVTTRSDHRYLGTQGNSGKDLESLTVGDNYNTTKIWSSGWSVIFSNAVEEVDSQDPVVSTSSYYVTRAPAWWLARPGPADCCVSDLQREDRELLVL
jgi:hypothetical protein